MGFVISHKTYKPVRNMALTNQKETPALESEPGPK